MKVHDAPRPQHLKDSSKKQMTKFTNALIFQVYISFRIQTIEGKQYRADNASFLHKNVAAVLSKWCGSLFIKMILKRGHNIFPLRNK